MQIEAFPDLLVSPPVKPSPKPKPESKPESAEDIADRIAAEMFVTCQRFGLDPKALAMELKLREVVKFLGIHYSADEAMTFVVRLIDAIQERTE
jgi:hypothetical protein